MTTARDANGLTAEQADMLALAALQSACREPTRDWRIFRRMDWYEVAIGNYTLGLERASRGIGDTLAAAVSKALKAAGLMPPQ